MSGEGDRPPGLPQTKAGERGKSQLPRKSVMSPLAANLVRLMEQARENFNRRHSYSSFDPQWWMYNEMMGIINDYSPDWRRRVFEDKEALQEEGINTDNINLRLELSDEQLEERQEFFRAIKWAYGIAAYPQFTPKQKNVFRRNLRSWIKASNIDSVTLNEHQREVLTVIATATNTPCNPDQEEYHFSTILNQPEITEKEMEENPGYSTW